MKILAALDFSDTTESVIRTAKKIAAASSGNVLLLHVIPEDNSGMEFNPSMEPRQKPTGKYYREPDSTEEGDAVPLLHDRRFRELQNMADSLKDEGIETAVSIVHGDPVNMVLEHAEKEGVDLIAAGSHGHKTLYQLFVGSICAGLVRQSTIPVVIVPPKASGRKSENTP